MWIDLKHSSFCVPIMLSENETIGQPLRVLFGLCSASAIFQWIMDSLLADLKWQSCLVYLDSVVVFSASFSNHLIRLQQILLKAIQSTNLRLWTNLTPKSQK